MKKTLLIALMIVPFLTSCNNDKWKEITHEEAIEIENKILDNFVAPQYFIGSGYLKYNQEEFYNGEMESYSERLQFYRSFSGDGSDKKVGVEYLRVCNNELWELTAEDSTQAKPEDQKRSKEKISTDNPLEKLKESVLDFYKFTISSIENQVQLAKEDGLPYSFYSYDDKSLKVKVRTKGKGCSLDNDICYLDIEAAFENNLPALLYSSKDEGRNVTGKITFDYTKEPTISDEVNPTDWCN